MTNSILKFRNYGYVILSEGRRLQPKNLLIIHYQIFRLRLLNACSAQDDTIIIFNSRLSKLNLSFLILNSPFSIN